MAWLKRLTQNRCVPLVGVLTPGRPPEEPFRGVLSHGLSSAATTMASAEDAEWSDFLNQEFEAVADREGEAVDEDTVNRLRQRMEARYALLDFEGGLHGDSLLSSIDENQPGCRRRIEVRFYTEGNPSSHIVIIHHQAPEVLTLWKTDGWFVLSHFEMTLQAHRLRERLVVPHIRLRNQAIRPVDWDTRIAVAGGILEVFGQHDKADGSRERVAYRIKMTYDGDEVASVACRSRPGGWATLGDHFAELNRAMGGRLSRDMGVQRVLPENGWRVNTSWREAIAVSADDVLRVWVAI
ncbi:hypothetical protein HDZ31DRAFT_83310 [Schizophyllum fasciatum]